MKAAVTGKSVKIGERRVDFLLWCICRENRRESHNEPGQVFRVITETPEKALFFSFRQVEIQKGICGW